jgi:hypothetical protein
MKPNASRLLLCFSLLALSLATTAPDFDFDFIQGQG